MTTEPGVQCQKKFRKKVKKGVYKPLGEEYNIELPSERVRKISGRTASKNL